MEIIILVVLLVVLSEVSYLVYKKQPSLSTSSGSQRKVYVDTSALMDGRVVAAAQTGFIPGRLVIPKSVLEELQLLADSADSDKRSRARAGLDVAKQLQELDTTSVEILDDSFISSGGVDERLRELARKNNGAICTIDFNLNKVATVEGIPVLNVNDLAGSIRMAYLPGERLSLLLAQKGNDSHQAVGYLSDGTMVVVEKASGDIGKTVEIEFIRSIQTAAGRMLFAKKVSKPEATKSRNTRGRKKPTKQTAEDSMLSLVERTNK